jgi:hypothetical protein
MGGMGYGYGSECHLLRWMGRHRRAFDAAVCATMNKTDGPVDWLDLKFDANKAWPDRELKGLAFIADTTLRKDWQTWWPTSGNSQNWDAVGWWDEPQRKQPVLVEAKAHVAELYSKCGAKTSGRTRIELSLRETAGSLGVAAITTWLQPHYQLANRMAALHFLHSVGYAARLLLIYFVGDWQLPSRKSPQTVAEWAQPLRDQKTEMGLPAIHALSPYIHELFLHVTEAAAWSRPDVAAMIDLSAILGAGRAL